MKQPLLVRVFLTNKETASYRQQAMLTIKSFPLYLLLNILIYFFMVFTFSKTLSWQEHLTFGLGLLLIVLLTITLTKDATISMQTSARACVVWILIAGIFIFVWWQSYFITLYNKNNLDYLEQYIIMSSTMTFLGILTIGHFSRVSSLFVIGTLLNIAPRLLIDNFVNHQVLVLQILLVSLGQLFFLRTFNAHVSRLLDAEKENAQLLKSMQVRNLSLEQSNLSHSRYLSAASHDLRQPLHALALITNDVQRKNTEPKITGQLKKMELAIDSLNQSFNAILNLSRLDAGVVKPNLSFFPLQNLFKRLYIEYNDLAIEKQLSLTIRPSKLWLSSDEDMLYSILSNLVSNALRYTDKGGVLVGVRYGSKKNFKIVVYDSGSGVPPEKAKQIFQEYKRLDEAEKRVRGGVGLGLAIVERTAQLLNTKLWVKSIMGKGSAFGIIADATLNPQEAAQPLVHDLLINKRIAIIDDDEWALDSLQDLLLDWKMDVSLILSSDMLIEIMDEEGIFDFIISDHNLGNQKETGLDLIKIALNYSPKNPPICLILTGDTSSDLTQNIIEAGVSLWHKPIRPASLRSHLNSLAQKKQRLNQSYN